MRRLFALLSLVLCFSVAYAADINNPAPLIGRAVTPLRGTMFGDSKVQTGAVNVRPTDAFTFSGTNGTLGWQVNSVEGWEQSFSDGVVYFDPQLGYPGNVNGLWRVIVMTQGSCTASSTLTFTPNAPGGTPANTASAFTLSFDASGHATVGTDIALGAPGSSATGSGYIAPPTFTVSGGSCTTQPTFAYVLTGTANYGVAGDRTKNMIFRVKDVCASAADFTVFNGGVNDIINGVAVGPATTADTIEYNIQQIATGLTCGGRKRVLLESISPVTNGTSGWSDTMEKQRLRVNAFMWQLCQKAATDSSQPSIICSNSDKYLSDSTSAHNSILAAATIDGVHFSAYGAQVQAIMDLAAMQVWFGHGKYHPHSQLDVYDATNNPFGNQISTLSVTQFTGTGGTNASPCNAAVFTGWTQDANNTVQLACTFSQESSRTDGLTGTRGQVALTDTGGTTGDRIRLQTNVSKNNFTLGTDSIQGSVFVDVSNDTGVVPMVGCEIFENVSSGNNQASVSLFGGTVLNGSNAVGLITSAQLNLMPEAKAILPDWALTGTGSYRLNCEMPPMLTQSTATSYTLWIYIYQSGTSSVTVKLDDAIVRKSWNTSTN